MLICLNKYIFMRYFITVILILLLLLSFGQKAKNISIDTSNYYDYANTVTCQDWLRINEAVPIILDELEKAGYSDAFIKVGELIRLDDSTRLVLTVSFLKEPWFGFVYEGSHMVPVSKSDRHFMSSETKEGFMQIEKGVNGKTNIIRIGQLPSNVFLLKQTCYWYESKSDPKKVTVTKIIAENILRQDVRKYLQQVKNLSLLKTR